MKRPTSKGSRSFVKRNRKPLVDIIAARTANGYELQMPTARARLAAQWLRALSDGYVIFDEGDIGMAIPGPVVVREME